MKTGSRVGTRTQAVGILLLGLVSCGGNNSKPKSTGTGGSDAGPNGVACKTDSDCASHVPPTTPANCAVGTCNTIEGVCVFSAKDEDGDGHPAANCQSTNGVPVVDGDDCDDSDANLYPGHPDTCTKLPEGGVGCTLGHVTCESDGAKSPCKGSAACDTGMTCCDATCVNELTDTSNCGKCGQICNAGPDPACTSGWCDYTLASGQHPTGAIAVDAANVYWATFGPGSSATMMKVPTSGGTPITVVSGLQNPTSMAVDSASAYWINFGCPGAVMKAPLSGGAPITLMSGLCYPPPSIAVDSTSVYAVAPAVVKVPLAGGTPITLYASSNAQAVAVDSTRVYWTESNGGGAVMDVPLSGGSPSVLASGFTGSGIAVDPTSVYWTDIVHGAVLSVPLSGGTPTTLASGQSGATDIAVDTASVYWIDQDISGGANAKKGVVMKVPLSGGVATTLASGQATPQGIAIDATSVYWTDGNLGTVMKAPK